MQWRDGDREALPDQFAHVAKFFRARDRRRSATAATINHAISFSSARPADE
jgi:hypothetical protein